MHRVKNTRSHAAAARKKSIPINVPPSRSTRRRAPPNTSSEPTTSNSRENLSTNNEQQILTITTPSSVVPSTSSPVSSDISSSIVPSTLPNALVPSTIPSNALVQHHYPSVNNYTNQQFPTRSYFDLKTAITQIPDFCDDSDERCTLSNFITAYSLSNAINTAAAVERKYDSRNELLGTDNANHQPNNASIHVMNADNFRCYECGETGHLRNNCPVLIKRKESYYHDRRKNGDRKYNRDKKYDRHHREQPSDRRRSDYKSNSDTSRTLNVNIAKTNEYDDKINVESLISSAFQLNSPDDSFNNYYHCNTCFNLTPVNSLDGAGLATENTRYGSQVDSERMQGLLGHINPDTLQVSMGIQSKRRHASINCTPSGRFSQLSNLRKRLDSPEAGVKTRDSISPSFCLGRLVPGDDENIPTTKRRPASINCTPSGRFLQPSDLRKGLDSPEAGVKTRDSISPSSCLGLVVPGDKSVFITSELEEDETHLLNSQLINTETIRSSKETKLDDPPVRLILTNNPSYVTTTRDKLSMRKDNLVHFTSTDGTFLSESSRDLLKQNKITMRQIANNAEEPGTAIASHDNIDLENISNSVLSLKYLLEHLQIKTVSIPKGKNGLNETQWSYFVKGIKQQFLNDGRTFTFCIGDIRFPPERERPNIIREYHESVISGIQANAVANLEKAKNRSKNYYDRKQNPRTFHLNDMVLLLKEPRTSKFDPQWDGPYQIVEILSDRNVKILLKGHKTKVVHNDKLKLAHIRVENDSETSGNEHD
ncbi:hypothetical protein KQX54_002129 [Cotesia glomerata]|uniref:CCHC-type domain-containing protein n=1 Tax=Cotesia glomerata TaxID=32391 RepID=A0AAV7I3C6_COTGL|nr:hypothetical protein KQX54_002129 [Cotesia glomerata]